MRPVSPGRLERQDKGGGAAIRVRGLGDFAKQSDPRSRMAAPPPGRSQGVGRGRYRKRYCTVRTPQAVGEVKPKAFHTPPARSSARP